MVGRCGSGKAVWHEGYEGEVSGYFLMPTCLVQTELHCGWTLTLIRSFIISARTLPHLAVVIQKKHLTR